MLPDKISAIVRVLLKKSISGEVEWKPTAEADVFGVSFSEYSLRVCREDPGGDDPYVYTVVIVDSEGRVVDEYWAHSIKIDVSHEELRDLFELARRRAMGVDAALDSLIGELGISDEDLKPPQSRSPFRSTGHDSDEELPF